MEDNDKGDNNKDDNNDKSISALGLDRDLGFSRGHQGIGLMMITTMRIRTTRCMTMTRMMTTTRTTTTTRVSQLWD